MSDTFNVIKISVILQTFAPLISILLRIDVVIYFQSTSSSDNNSMYVFISFTLFRFWSFSVADIYAILKSRVQGISGTFEPFTINSALKTCFIWRWKYNEIKLIIYFPTVFSFFKLLNKTIN